MDDVIHAEPIEEEYGDYDKCLEVYGPWDFRGVHHSEPMVEDDDEEM